MPWNMDKEKLRCLIVLNDSIAEDASREAGNAFFRAFILEDRESHELFVSMRFNYKGTGKSWVDLTPKNSESGKEAVDALAINLKLMLEQTWIHIVGKPMPEEGLNFFYPPDDEGDPTKTTEWLLERDLIQIVAGNESNRVLVNGNVPPDPSKVN